MSEGTGFSFDASAETMVATDVSAATDVANMGPYVYDGRPYKRVQSSTTVMSQDEYEKMLAARGGFRSKSGHL